MSQFRHLNSEQALQLMSERQVQVADIRDSGSYTQGHIAGAVQLSNENLADFIAQADPQNPLLVVCYHGVSSQGASQYLAEQGFREVYSLDGGMSSFAIQYPEMLVSGL